MSMDNLDTKAHRRLRRFLRKSELTAKDLAQLSGLTPMQISHLICGRRRASLEVAVALEKVTQGAVAPRAWLEKP